jgi:ATP synthase protein I
MSKPSDPPPSLEELQRQIEEADPESTKQDESLANSGLMRAMRVGSDLVAGIVVGTVLGYYLDRWFGTEPLFLITGLFLGAATVFRSMWRSAMGKPNETKLK